MSFVRIAAKAGVLWRVVHWAAVLLCPVGTLARYREGILPMP